MFAVPSVLLNEREEMRDGMSHGDVCSTGLCIRTFVTISYLINAERIVIIKSTKVPSPSWGNALHAERALHAQVDFHFESVLFECESDA